MRLPVDLPGRQVALSCARGLLLVAVLAVGSAEAATFTWDGREYIPLGLQPRSQAVLRLPEKLTGYIAEEPAALTILTIDERTIAFSPRQEEIEQRIFLRGEGGALYIARASTRTEFFPLLEVERVATAPADTEYNGASSVVQSPVPMMLRLMQGRPPRGFRVTRSERTLLVTDDFRLRAEQVWSSPKLTGVVASFERLLKAGTRVEIKADLIEVSIPDLGLLRMIGADRYVLDDAHPSTAAFLIFVRD